MKRKVAAILILALLVFCAGALADSVRFTGDCNVRSGPGLGYSVIGSVNSGSYLTYLDSSSVDYRGVTWYEVSFRGGIGWVSSVYAYITGSSGNATYGGGSGGSSGYSGGYSSSGNTVYAGSGDTNVRTGPGLGYTSVGTLYKGQSATYLGDTSYDSRGVAWYKIRWNGQARWVSSVYTWIR